MQEAKLIAQAAFLRIQINEIMERKANPLEVVVFERQSYFAGDGKISTPEPVKPHPSGMDINA